MILIISELIAELKSLAETAVEENNTCDRVKIGDAEREITKVAVSMFATPQVIMQSSEWGANFLIVHEPVFYSHYDRRIRSVIGLEKKKLLRRCGMTVFRFHDYAHSMRPDLIYAGQIGHLGLEGEGIPGKYFGVNRFHLKNPMTARELAEHIEKNYGICHVGIAGCADKKAQDISCCFGTPGHVAEELDECSFVLTGEICEWCEGEIARDYAQLGYNKAILVMGHIGSEREGMILFAETLQRKHPEIQTKYFECGEVYQYTEG